jgi:hypothetical protein
MIRPKAKPSMKKNLAWVLAKTFKCAGIKVFNHEEKF